MPKKKSERRFALIEKEILTSKAWIMLTHSERVIYVHLKGEYRGYDSDKLQLPYLHHMKQIMGRQCFYSGIRRLEEVGFIDCVSVGQKTKFEKGCPRTPANTYRLSGRWRIHGQSLSEYQAKRNARMQGNLFGEYCGRQEDETEP